MQLEYRLSLKDYQEANLAHLKSQRGIYFFFLFFIILGLILLTLFVITGTKFNIFGLVVCFYLMPIIFFNPYFSNLIHKYGISIVWKGLHNCHHPTTIVVNEELLNIKTFNCESNFQWEIYIKAIETKNLFLLYPAKTLFEMIPKRAFSSDEEVDEFRELLRTKIEKFQKV